jgi:cytochrome c oxidase assembly protein subunit 15
MDRNKKIVIIWLSAVIFSVIIQILLGGYVRLTDSGLSMYDWHVVKGIVPPLSEEAWQETFENYKKTPEYQKINIGMSLDDYKLIYIREYNHRILGRVTGLIFVLPLFFFLFSGRLNWRKSKIYLLTGLLYAGQGILGWYMVQSGLVDHPHVSHLRLAAHFLLALLILALIFWKLLDTVFEQKVLTFKSLLQTPLLWLVIFTILFTIQATYGAFVAGLKAGLVSDTFPLMFGFIIPPNLFSSEFGGILNWLENSVMVHFIHRWFAFVVLGYSVFAWLKLKEQKKISYLLPLSIMLQIIAGLTVICFHVPVSLALLHQFGAVVILSVTVYLMHFCAPQDRS